MHQRIKRLSELQIIKVKTHRLAKFQKLSKSKLSESGFAGLEDYQDFASNNPEILRILKILIQTKKKNIWKKEI